LIDDDVQACAVFQLRAAPGLGKDRHVGLCVALHALLEGAGRAVIRINPKWRDRFDARLRDPLVRAVQALVNLTRRNEGLGLAEERPIRGEEELAEAIAREMRGFLETHYRPGGFERAGNTKTYGMVRGTFEVLPDLPAELRVGIFAAEAAFPAWVRFAGPGPFAPADPDDNGILSIGVKVMGVPGPKLLDDERMTQDFTGISAPTFTTPNVVENLELQRQVRRGTPVFYFVNPLRPHLCDMLMQGLYARLQSSPLEVRYYSCVPYAFGLGCAVQYTFSPASPERTPIPRPPTANYLREAMVRRLSQSEAVFDFAVQFQTEPHRMPIEHAGVVWPEKLSPRRTIARLRLPMQTFASPAQLAFADRLSYNPWHCLEAHRPLGSQNRARRHIYATLARLRQERNEHHHIEPTGSEPSPEHARGIAHDADRLFLAKDVVAAALFNFAIGIPLMLVPGWTLHLAFYQAGAGGDLATRLWSDFGFCVALIGVGYWMVARDLGNRALVWLGVGAKSFDVVVLTWRWAIGVAKPLVLVPAAIDAVFLALFLAFLFRAR
jgi:hypothetical protein